MTLPEFSRRIRVDEISLAPRNHNVAAKPGERALLTVRFGLSSIDRLDADIALSRSEEHTSELQSLMRISYAVFCLKKKITRIILTLRHCSWSHSCNTILPMSIL